MKRIRILVLIPCACFVSVAWGQRNGWSEFHRRNMQRWNPYEKVLNVKTVRKLALKWSYATGGFVDSSPAVANGVVFGSATFPTSSGWMYALNAGTGALVWSYLTGSYSYV